MFRALLGCGFTPLHLQTFFTAHLQQLLPARKVALSTGLYGDLIGTVRRACEEAWDAVAIAIEWPDLDPRLGYRNLGGWGPREETDILAQVGSALGRFRRALAETAQTKVVVVSMPTLPLPPVFHTVSRQSSARQAALEAAVQEAAADLAVQGKISIVNPQQLAIDSPPASRFDLKSELLLGLPYTLPHASALAGTMARLVSPPAPKKGVITDLDNTFWKGIVGETGPDGVTWDLTHHSQLHGLYQQTLRALADQGVLVGIASKNDPAVVAAAFARQDLILPKEKIFPLEVHWHAKSGSIGRILKAWNIGADAVVFVDDSPMELAEVKAVYAQMECLLFPAKDYTATAALLRQLRDLCGKPRLSEEDAIRRESLRTAAEFEEKRGDGGEASEEFLQGLNATISVDKRAAADPRSLELVNKTNQFNLNGRRLDPSAWQTAAGRDGAFVWSIAYQDKFGPLGKIAVVQGLARGGEIQVDTWVMSCRAFARRIEHQVLRLLFEEAGASEITFCFQATDRNGPLQDFLAAILGQPPAGSVRLSREAFFERCPPLVHNIQWSRQ